MDSTAFRLTTLWTLDAAPDAVWAELIRPEDWPSWWRAVAKVEVIEPGSADGTGAYRRFTWRTALPYTISFNMRATRIELMRLIEGRADGELSGLGRWTLTPSGAGTQVRYDWIVEVTKSWMRVGAPLLRPLFTWNHNKVMEWGSAGLQQKLTEPDRRYI